MSRRTRQWIRRTLIGACLLLILQHIFSGSSLDQGDWRPKRVLIVTAHPDDETMFFAPAILGLLALVGSQIHISGLCLTVGDAAGLGRIRAQELRSAYDRLGVASDSVSALDDTLLPDGMQVRWPLERVVERVRRHEQEYGPFDTVLTFDQGGVTQHPNHVDCYTAVRQLLEESRDVQGFALRTLPVVTKFTGLPGALWRHVTFRFARRSRNSDLPKYAPGLLQPASIHSTPPNRISFLSSPLGYYTTIRAMAQHRTQLVWFRYLYVIFSSYMFNVQFEAIV